MPRNPFRRDAAAEPRASDAQAPPNRLTRELLDWLITALEAVLRTPQAQEYANRRAEASLRDALKQADQLYPATKEFQDARTGSARASGPVVGDQDRPVGNPPGPNGEADDATGG